MVSNGTADGETVILCEFSQAFLRAMAMEVLQLPESGEPLLVEAFRRAHFFEDDLQSPR